MPYRFYKSLTPLFGSLLLLLPLYTQAQNERWYRVEMLIFSNSGGSTSEEWEATPTLTYPATARSLTDSDHQSATGTLGERTSPPFAPAVEGGPDSNAEIDRPRRPTPFVTLPDTQLEFRRAVAQMQRNGRYRKLFHKAWTQPIGRKSEARSIVLDRSGDTGQWPALQGTIKFYVSRYLYLETDLWLNTSGEYLESSWRMPPPPLGPRSAASFGEMTQSEPVPFPAVPPSPADQVNPAEVYPVEALPEVEEELAYPYRHAVLLQQTRRMRSKEVNYIDHPMFGVVVKVTPLAAVESESDTGIESR
jgi:hypothetical protein